MFFVFIKKTMGYLIHPSVSQQSCTNLQGYIDTTYMQGHTILIEIMLYYTERKQSFPSRSLCSKWTAVVIIVLFNTE